MIRIAKKQHLPRIVELVKAGIEERNVGYEVQEATLADSIYRSFMMCPQFIVIEDDGMVGVASLTLGNFPWSQKPYLTSNMVYVLPEKRKYNIIDELYKAIKGYAELQGILYVDTFFGTDKIDGRARLARSQGLKQTGISIMYEAK